MSSEWFNKFVSAKRGTLDNNYVAEYDARISRLDLLKLELRSDTVLGLHYISDDLKHASVPVIPG